MIRSKSIFGLFALGLLALGCDQAAVGSSEPVESTATTTEALLVDRTESSISREFMALDLMYPAGVAGGRDVVFVGSPLEGRVAAYSRRQKVAIGDLPAPPDGFILPFIMKSTSDWKVAVLDAGGFPSPGEFVPAMPTVYEYSYSYTSTNGFSARLVRSVSFREAIIGFAEDAIQLSDGRFLVNDTVLGSIWISEADGSVRQALGPASLEPADAIPQMYYCPTMPLIQVGGIPFLFTDSTVPGITSMAERDGMLYFTSSCAGAVYKIPLASLDDNRQPWERAADIQLVSSKPDGVEVEELLGLTFNPYKPTEPWAYAADALQLRVIRINVQTGERQIIGSDPWLFNFPSSINFAPPTGEFGITPLLTLSNQQHRTVLLNDAITEDIVQPPFLLTETLVDGAIYAP